MKQKMINETHIEGIIYEHTLELKVSGPTSKNPGTEFITGEVRVATNDALDNIVPVHFTYVTATTGKGTANATFGVLKDIIDGKIGSYMAQGPDNAGKIRIDSAIGLNEWYTERDGKEELVSTKRNEGGFIHTTGPWKADEKEKDTFTVDMIITKVTRQDANPEKDIPEKVLVKGAIFDFRKALLPVEFSVINPNAMNYFEGLEASSKNPVFTKLKGRQISETVVRKIVEESAFGEASVREVPSSRKDWVITWAQREPYIWDDEETITAEELTKASTDRQTYLATIHQRQEEYKASKAQAAAAAKAPATSGYDF